MSSISSKFAITLLVVCMALLCPEVLVQEANAGVLLRSGRVRSQVRTRTPRMRLGFKKASTWVSVSRKINPINSQTMTSDKALARYSRNRERYMRELKRYEARRARNAQRLAKRRERQKARELRDQKRRMQRVHAKQKRKQDLEKRLDSSESGQKADSDSPNVKIQGQKKSQPSFWRRFWQKLIGGN